MEPDSAERLIVTGEEPSDGEVGDE